MDNLTYRMTAPPNDYPEWVINDVPLVELLGVSEAGLVPPLVWWDAEIAAKRLLLATPSLLPTGRQALLVCGVCGDIGCGVISADVKEQRGAILWSNFAWESGLVNDPEGHPSPDLEEFAGIGPFYFDRERYHRIIGEMLHVGAPANR